MGTEWSIFPGNIAISFSGNFGSQNAMGGPHNMLVADEVIGENLMDTTPKKRASFPPKHEFLKFLRRNADKLVGEPASHNNCPLSVFLIHRRGISYARVGRLECEWSRNNKWYIAQIPPWASRFILNFDEGGINGIYKDCTGAEILKTYFPGGKKNL
jgi:hypothetical protein